MNRSTELTAYLPFIDDPAHLSRLNAQRFVVLRAPLPVSAAFDQAQGQLRDRLRGQPVSFPARPHITLCGLAAGARLETVQELVNGWAPQAPRLQIEVEQITWFPSPFQIVVMEVRKTPPLFAALSALRAQAVEHGLVVSTIMPVDQWRFHMSLAYCSELTDRDWQDATGFVQTLTPPSVSADVNSVEVVAFDAEREYSGGVYALGS